LELAIAAVPGACIKRPSHSGPRSKALYSARYRFNGRHTRLPLGRRTARSKETIPPRHRFLEPIHNVKERGEPLRSAPACRREDLVFIPGNWWSQSGSNRRPQACKASALPTELWPRKVTKVTPPTRAGARGAESGAMVGRVGVEPTTSRLSGVRSNHLSYRPPCQTRATRAAGGWMPAQVC
jgi:hypothetical protein